MMFQDPSPSTKELNTETSIALFLNLTLDKINESPNIYRAALSALSKSDDWICSGAISSLDLVRRVAEIKSEKCEDLEKIHAIYTKIVSKESPLFLQRDQPTPNSEILNALKRLAQNDLSGQSSPASTMIDDFFLAQKFGLKNVSMKILRNLLAKDPDFKSEMPNPSQAERDFISLLAQMKKNGLEVCVEFRGNIETLRKFSRVGSSDVYGIRLKDSSSAESWECLTKLNACIPFTRLSLQGKLNQSLFSSYLQVAGRIPLTHLEIGDGASFDDNYFKEIAPYLDLNVLSICGAPLTAIPKASSKNLHFLLIRGCFNLEELNLPEVKRLICRDCSKLKTLHCQTAERVTAVKCSSLEELSAPKALKVDCRGCTSLMTLTLPVATRVHCSDCTALKTLTLRNAKRVNSDGCITLKSLTLPVATRVNCNGCTALESLTLPVAKRVYCSNCTALVTLALPQAMDVNCNGCTTLESLTLPVATRVKCSCCSSLKTLTLPEATQVKCRLCTALVTLNLPKATEVDCSDCTALVALALPEATKVDCSDCDALETLTLPKAVDVNYEECYALIALSFGALEEVESACHPALQSLFAAKARTVNCSNCTNLKTLTLPEAIKVNSRLCTSLETLSLPKALEIDSSDCSSLESLSCPEAISVWCTGCKALSTLNAPNLLVLKCAGTRALRTLNIPIIVEISPTTAINRLPLSEEQRAFQKMVNSYEIDPVILTPESEVLAVPALDLTSIARLSSPIDLNSLQKELMNFALNLEMDDQTALYSYEKEQIQNGGQFYGKTALTNGLTLLFQEIKTEVGTQHLLQKIYKEVIANVQCSKYVRTGALIRLTVSSLEGIEEVEKSLHLFYRLEQLLSFFDSLNFDKPSQSDYIEPIRMKNDAGSLSSAAEIKGRLVRLFDYVRNRKAYLGTPSSEKPKELRLYYQSLERYLQLIAINLEKSSDWDERATHLIDLGMAAEACGTRWLGDAEQIYRLSCRQSHSLTIPDLIHAKDGEFKLGIVEELAKDSTGVINVHTYQQYKTLLADFGIPGSASLAGIPDPTLEKRIPLRVAQHQFKLKYSLVPVLHMQRKFLCALFSDFTKRDLLLDFIKEMRPADWEGEGALLSHIRQLEKANTPREEIRQSLKNKGCFCIRPDWNLEAALKEYLENNTPKHTLEAIAELKAELSTLTIKEQKERLQKEGIPLGPDDPDFATEVILKQINSDYLESLLEKDSAGDATFSFTWEAMFEILERVKKLRKKPATGPVLSPPGGPVDLGKRKRS